MKTVSAPRVLIVDDERPMLELYDAALRRIVAPRVVIDTCTSGEEAALRLQGGDYAMVISDFRMGALSGIDLLEISSRESPATIRILMTGFAELSMAQDAIERGHVQGFVAKPTSLAETARALGDALQTHLAP